MRIGVVVPNQRATVRRVIADLATAERLGYDSAEGGGSRTQSRFGDERERRRTLEFMATLR